MEWISVIEAFGLLLVGGSGTGLLFYQSAKRKAEAEAKAKEWELEDKRIAQLHESIRFANDTNTELLERIGTLNRALDAKTDRIRSLTDRAMEAELTVNRVNEQLNEVNKRVAQLTEARDKERMLKELYKQWVCHRSSCTEREPPNMRLKGKQLREQEEELIYNLENHNKAKQ